MKFSTYRKIKIETAADGRDSVPYDVTFTWYDYNNFDDKEKLLSDFNFSDDNFEDENTKNTARSIITLMITSC
ncbi:hypothetical protein [Jeotgalicoccus sp. WY2]|uniref:hypothetical protein n=1 Tax=Jeotgalicoccus sp. WY2 TaxID=2708346 RepID=UPI001BD24F23|nr:hypothetical protein [Jeotgalicoccus sp. WY2]